MASGSISIFIYHWRPVRSWGSEHVHCGRRNLWNVSLKQPVDSHSQGEVFSTSSFAVLSSRGGNRKLLILFNWLTPLTTIMAQQSVPFSSERSSGASKSTARPFLQAALYAPPPVLLDLVNSVSDDIYTFSRLGLLGKRTGERAGRFSDWCWLLGTLVNLVENGLERSVVGNLQREGQHHITITLWCYSDIAPSSSGSAFVHGGELGSNCEIESQKLQDRWDRAFPATSKGLLVTGLPS